MNSIDGNWEWNELDLKPQSQFPEYRTAKFEIDKFTDKRFLEYEIGKGAHKHITEADRERLEAMLKTNMHSREIAEKMKLNSNQLSFLVHTWGLQTMNRDRSQRIYKEIYGGE